MGLKNLLVLLLVAFAMLEGLAATAAAGSTGRPVSGNAETNALARPIRGLHFVLGPRGPSRPAIAVGDAKALVSSAKRAGFNLIIVQIANSVRFDRGSQVLRPGAWSKEAFADFVEFARAQGIEVIPEIKLLTHQEKFFVNRHPSLMYNSVTYDPRQEGVYDEVLPLFDEIISVSHPKAIHIGHDEVAGFKRWSRKKWLEPGEDVLPAELFKRDVLRLHEYLEEQGVETWMWGDMLIAPDEFPAMLSKHFHGTLPGYGKSLRESLPRDIVVCDWHYEDDQLTFPSIEAVRKDGFRVVGATFENEQTVRNFSRYAAENGADGMIATTWFHVPRKEWDIVNRIISVSGAVFEKDFPNAER
jgi:hypothetical protein